MAQEDSVVALVDSIFGTPNTPTPKNESMLDSVLNAISTGDQKEKSFQKDNYAWLQEHIDSIKVEFEETLQSYFPDRWDWQPTPMNSNQIDNVKKLVNNIRFDDVSNRKEFMEKLIRANGYNACHQYGKSLLLIHFPEITIRNRQNNTHKIMDLYMKFEYNFVYRMLTMNGIRATKTYGEYAAGYNHSHMNVSQACDSGTNLRCCLGSTDYATLTTQMHHNYDPNQNVLFYQQLGDYLAWESLDGGPYMRINDIGSKSYSTLSRNYLNGNTLLRAYNDFLIKFPKGYNIQLEDNGAYYNFKVIKDEQFKDMVTKVCPEEHKQLYDTLQKKQYIDNSNNQSSRGIQQMNEGFKRTNKLFTFKGQPIYFQIHDPNAGAKVENPNVVKVAPQQMIDWIAQQLEQKINVYYIQEFAKDFLKK